jgi:hypothetical protein
MVLERSVAPEPTVSPMKKFLIAAAIFGVASISALAALDTAKIDNLTGLKGKLNEKEGVYRVTFPRSDVKIAVDGWTMPPFMGLGHLGFIHARFPYGGDGDGRYGCL